jgi:hypothetical protein
MIIVKSEGRLGNQLFVLAALLRETEGKHRITLVGFEDVGWLMSGHLKKVYKISYAPSFFFRHWKKTSHILALLSKMRLLKTVRLSPNSEALEFDPGILPVARFAAGYCQKEKLIDVSRLATLWSWESARREKLLASWGLVQKRHSLHMTCFVHVRRGDYLFWPSADFPAALPAEWFREQMERVKKSTQKDVRFLIFSDDPTYCSHEFTGIPNTQVADLSAEESFLVMSHCDAGILSASTFSWWAARLAALDSSGPFYAPRYWFGWPQRQWDREPSRDSEFLEWVTVETSR